MLSKIRIALDGDKNPVVRIDFRTVETGKDEDLKDELVQEFLEGFFPSSCVASFAYDPTISGTVAVLKPVAIKDYPEQIALMQAIYDEFIQPNKIGFISTPLPASAPEGALSR